MPMDADVKQEDLGFDPAALRAKYLAERDRRIRADGNEQYREIAGDFAHYLDDPYVAPGFTRAPLTDEIEVVVIGGGFGGLLAAARLREAGVDDIRLIEKGGDGGLAAVRFAFQRGLEFGRNAPTIDFGLHALHCSASSNLACRTPEVCPTWCRGELLERAPGCFNVLGQLARSESATYRLGMA